MANNSPLQLSAAELEGRLDTLLREWSSHAAAMPVATDQQLQIRARLRQMQQSDSQAQVDVAAVLGPLLCKSPQSLAAFGEFCSCQVHQRPTAFQQLSAKNRSPVRQPHSDVTTLQRQLWLRASVLAIIGALLVTLWAGWSEWRQKLCSWELWGQRFCETLPESGPPPKAPKNTVSGPIDNADLAPIIQPVITAVRQPKLTFVRADLDPIEAGIFRSRGWLLVPPFIGLLLGWAFASYKRHSLEQRLSKLPTWRQQLNLIDVAQLQPLFTDSASRKSIVAAQYRTGHRRQLDISATIDASVQRQLPTLVKRARRVRSSYVFAIPMQTRSDWRGQYFATLVKELQHSGLQAQLFFYWRSPQELYPERNRSQSASLDYWRQQHSISTLVVLADQQTIFHPLFGNELAWLPQLHHWSSHLLVFTTALSPRQAKQLQQGGYQLHSGVDAAGVTRLLLQLVADDPQKSLAEPESTSGFALPASLAHLGEVQAMTTTADAAEVEELIRWLKYRLGKQAFRLFCASVLFPRPDWRLTRALAHRLAAGSSAEDPPWHATELLMRGSPRLLAPLAQLPWSRHGYFPLWLRRAMSNQLSAADKTQISALLRSFMAHIDEKSIDPMQLTIDTPVTHISAWLRWAKRDGPAHDGLFASILNRGPLAFLLDRWQQHNLHNRLQTALIAAGGAIAAGLLGAMVWNLAPRTATIEQQVARRCALNDQHRLLIEHTPALQQQAEVLQVSLQALCYQPELLAVDSFTQTTASFNSLQATPAHAVLLNRAITYALYQAPLESRQLAVDAAQSIFSLQAPIQSGQVFRAPFLANDPLPAPQRQERVAKALESNQPDGSSPTQSVDVILPDMQPIEAGAFNMGSDSGRDSEKPVHRVSVAAFEMARHELTWGEWQRCEAAGVCRVLERPDWINEMDAAEGSRHPVVNVSWDQAQVYIGWINSVTAGGYRLPSEAELEYALRAVTESEYPWGTAEQCVHSNGRDQAYQRANSDSTWPIADCDDAFVYTAPVGSFVKNTFALYDVSGNAWEWVQDCWNGNYDGAPGDGSAWETGGCDRRVLRGGGWYSIPENLRSAFRFRGIRDIGSGSVGFRLARTP